MTVEALIEQAHARSLRVLNLFELHTGQWQANFERENTCFNFGRGDTPVEALTVALAEYDAFQKQLRDKAARQPRKIEPEPEEDLFA
jgi:hypothetical protein